MRLFVTLWITAVLFFTCQHGYGASARYEKLTKSIDTAVMRAITEKRLVGAVVIVAHKSTVVHQKAYGFLDREKGIPMRQDAIFRLSSLTKAFTAMAAAALLDQGNLQLDAPVTRWLPDFTPALNNGKKPVITIRHLLSHTAGLDYGFAQHNDGPYRKAGISDGLDISPLTLEQEIALLTSVPLLYAPGTSWRNSLAADVLGAVVGKAHGTSFEIAMQDLVLDPLGLKDTGFSVSDLARLAPPYCNALPEPRRMRNDERIPMEKGELRFAPERILRSDQFASGGVGMAGTASDMLVLLETIRTGGEPVAGQEVMKKMMLLQSPLNCVSPGTGFALGWGVVHDPSAAKRPEAAGTIGWGGGYGHSWTVDPVNEVTVVLMTNTALEGVFGKVVTDVQQAVYRGLPTAR